MAPYLVAMSVRGVESGCGLELLRLKRRAQAAWAQGCPAVQFSVDLVLSLAAAEDREQQQVFRRESLKTGGTSRLPMLTSH
jgi:hypothetical protein